MEELLCKIREIVRDETAEIKARLGNVETKVDSIDNRMCDLETRMDNIEEDTTFLRKTMFAMENDYFNKIDVMYDYVLLQKEMNDMKFKNIEKMEKTVERNELKILNHDTRIEVLEKNLSQPV